MLFKSSHYKLNLDLEKLKMFQMLICGYSFLSFFLVTRQLNCTCEENCFIDFFSNFLLCICEVLLHSTHCIAIRIFTYILYIIYCIVQQWVLRTFFMHSHTYMLDTFYDRTENYILFLYICISSVGSSAFILRFRFNILFLF